MTEIATLGGMAELTELAASLDAAQFDRAMYQPAVMIVLPDTFNMTALLATMATMHERFDMPVVTVSGLREDQEHIDLTPEGEAFLHEYIAGKAAKLKLDIEREQLRVLEGGFDMASGPDMTVLAGWDRVDGVTDYKVVNTSTPPLAAVVYREMMKHEPVLPREPRVKDWESRQYRRQGGKRKGKR